MEQVKSKNELKKAQSLLKKNLLSHNKYKRLDISLGHKGGGSGTNSKAYYFQDYNIWWAPKIYASTEEFDVPVERYWNAFGIGRPNQQNTSIVVEINFPLEGRTRMVAGVILKENDEFFLFHTGKIGGGRKGIGKSGFFDYYEGSIDEVDVDGELEELVPFGSFLDPHLIDSIAHFVHEVDDIKLRCVSPEHTQDLEIRKEHKFNPEFFGLKQFQKQKRSKKTYTSNHGRVVSELHKKLKTFGIKTANTRLVDLYAYSGKSVNIIFEVKSALSRQSIYTALGQLMLHSTGRKKKPKMVFVIPEKLPNALSKKLKSLGVLTLRYSMDGKQINFYRLNEIIKHA